MTNNIFVPQTFNGERMVNVNLPNRRVGNQPMNEPSAATPTNPNTTAPAPAPAPASASASASAATTPTSTITTAGPTRLRIAPATSEATSPKNLKIKISNPPPPPPSSASFAPPPPSSASFAPPSSSFAPSPNTFSSKPVPYSPHTTTKSFQKYWSEANIAVLIQLHRKYFNTNANDPNLDNTWSLLTKEYNAITCEERSKQTVKKRWNKVMRKYNAERCCLHVQKTSASQQQMPPVSYWNHFLYLDGYLSHLPIPDDSLYIRHDDEDEDEDYDLVGTVEKKRKLDTTKVLESLLEQTMARQQTQIESIKTHYDDMNKMNLKFVDMCEKVTLRNQSNESRFLDLLEKIYKNKTE